MGSLTLDAAGNVYGTTPDGGEFGGGTVFKVTPTGTESILYNFCVRSHCRDGYYPNAGMARDGAGNLYGTASLNGEYGEGVVFKLSPDGTYTPLHSFDYSSTDGSYPESNFSLDWWGNLYSTTEDGGASYHGTVFKVTAIGTESLLYSFKGWPADGAAPSAMGLLRDTAGNFYGVTAEGSENNLGVLFKRPRVGRRACFSTSRVLVVATPEACWSGMRPETYMAWQAVGRLWAIAGVWSLS